MGCFSTTVEAPDPVDPAQVGRDSLQTQIELAPDVLAAEQETRPEYAKLDQQILADSLLGTNGAPGLLDLNDEAAARLTESQITANRAQREADIADVMALGPQARQAYLAANPELATAMQRLDERINSAQPVSDVVAKLRADAADYDRVSPIQAELERQALDELALDGTLSASDQRLAQQSARAANATTGLYDSNLRIGDEILNADSLMRSRRDSARTFASGVDAAGQQALNMGRSFAGSVAEYDRSLSNDEIAQMFGLASTYQSQATDPFQMVLGRSGTPTMAPGVTGQAGYTQNSGARMFDPFNDSIMSIYSGNRANELAANTATANNRSNLLGAGIGALGSLGAGALARLGAGALICWAARAAFGADNPRWLVARRWMITRAPEQLRALYLSHGETLARRIAAEPESRQYYRSLFRRLIMHRRGAQHQLINALRNA